LHTQGDVIDCTSCFADAAAARPLVHCSECWQLSGCTLGNSVPRSKSCSSSQDEADPARGEGVTTGAWYCAMCCAASATTVLQRQQWMMMCQ